MEIVDVIANNQSCSCEECAVCGVVVQEDTMECFRRVWIINSKSQEEPTMVMLWAASGINCCCVGYLYKYLLK